MNNLIYSILLVLSILSPYVPLFFIIKNRRALNKQLSALFLYLLASILTEIIAIFTVENNAIVSLLFTIIEYSLIAYIFWIEFERRKFRIIISIFSVLFYALTVFCILNLDLEHTDHILTTSEAVIVITLGILYFYKIFSDLNIPKLTNYYYFWLNSAFLLYFSTALFLFLFRSYIQTMKDLAPFLWVIHLLINITSNILLTIGICKHRKT